MKTDRLIEMLSTNVEPVERGQIGKVFAWALVAGSIAAFCVMLASVGLRTDIGTHLDFLAIKLLFVLSLVGAGAAFLLRSIHPGQGAQKPFALVFVPFLAVGVAAAVVALLPGRSAPWGVLTFGTQWTTCLYCIPLFAAVPFAALIWALRNGAPTNLARTGAIAGLVAGALGAAAYSFHCPDDSLPFVAVWYGASIALCAFIGAVLGPRLLRW